MGWFEPNPPLATPLATLMLTHASITGVATTADTICDHRRIGLRKDVHPTVS